MNGSSDLEPRTFRLGAGLVFLGLWFILGGAVLTCSFAYVMMSAAPDEMPLWGRSMFVVGVFLGLGLLAFGVMIASGFARVTIDPSHRMLTLRRGFVYVWSRREVSFDGVRCVGVGCEGGHGPHGRGPVSTTFPVRIECDGDEIEIANPFRYQAARDQAEIAAKLIGVGLRDWSGEETVVRDAGSLDESVRARADREGEKLTWPKLPGGSKITCRIAGDEVVVDQPRVRGKELRDGLIGVGVLLGLWLAASIPGVLFLRSSIAKSGADGWALIGQSVLVALPMVPIVYVFLGAMVLAFSQERIIVSPRMLQRIWKLPVGYWTSRFPAEEIEEILIDGDNVVVRGDRGSMRLGMILRKSERRWLSEAVKFGLCLPHDAG